MKYVFCHFRQINKKTFSAGIPYPSQRIHNRVCWRKQKCLKFSIHRVWSYPAIEMILRFHFLFWLKCVTVQPNISRFQSLKIRRSTFRNNAKNVCRRILWLLSLETFGQDRWVWLGATDWTIEAGWCYICTFFLMVKKKSKSTREAEWARSLSFETPHYKLLYSS